MREKKIPPAWRHCLLALFLALACTAVLAETIAPTPPAPVTRWQKSADAKLALTKNVVWLSHEPLEFLLRRGGEHAANEPERYVTMVSLENFRSMAAAGVRYNQIYFYKGFGLEFEKPNFETARRAVAEMHSLGMKASLYVGGTMFTETFYRETPEAKGWERRDQHDHWISYGTQTFRHYACPNEPAYRAYIKRVLKYAVEEVKPDEIFFDNLMLQAEPDSCRCPRCLAAFGEFLRARYPDPASARRRFGLPDVSLIRINEWSSAEQAAGVTELNDPVLQEWVRFRCETLANYTIDLADYVKQLNPRISVSLNLKGVYSFNRYWTNAVYQPLYAGHFDSVDFDTGGFDAQIDPATGALVSQIRTYKMARRLGVSCIDFIQNDNLRAAVHLAFAYQKPNPSIPGAPWHEGLNNAFTPLLEFFREYNDRYYTGTENIADVAVLHNWPSLAYSIHAAYVPTTLVEQVLIQHKVPFDLLYEEQIDRIGRYGTVIVAGQECMSHAQADTLLRYVRNGGTLVVTDNTAQYNEWREAWPVNPLLPARTEGKGRIVYIPKVIPGEFRGQTSARIVNEDPEPGSTLQPGQPMSPRQWVLPFNHKEIYHAIVDGLPEGLSVTSQAPLTTVMEILNRAETQETIVHFVNFDLKHPTADFATSVRTQFPGKVKSVTCFSPDHNDPQSLAFEVQAGLINFQVPALRIYEMIVISYE